MQTKEFYADFSCSKQFNQGLHNQRISLSVIDILLGITAIVGNTVILIALYKETLLRNLVASDLCVGIAQLVSTAQGISILQGRWQICRLLSFVLTASGAISLAVSLWTLTAISVERLLALLLKFRYRQVVTLRKAYTAAIASWVCNVSVSPCKSFGVHTMYVLTIEGMKSVRPFFILEEKIEDSSSSALVVQKKCKTCHFASWIRRERLPNEFRWFKGYLSAAFLSLIMQIRNFSVVLLVG